MLASRWPHLSASLFQQFIRKARFRGLFLLPVWMALGVVPAVAQSARDQAAALREELIAMKEEHAKAIAALEARIAALESNATDAAQSGDAVEKETARVLDRVTTAKQKGQYHTYPDMTALDAYRETLPADMRHDLSTVPGKLFDYLAKGFEWHGYFRSGYGINSAGGQQEAFQAPGASAKYRLGNEAETYIETTALQKNWNPNPNGANIMSQIRLSYKAWNTESWDEDNKVVLREMYAGMDNFWSANPDTKVWAGQRFYRLPQLNINDFWWYDLSGYGGGFENVNLGWGKLALAYIGFSKSASSFWTSSDESSFTYYTDNGLLAKNNLSLILSDLKAPGGKLSVWVNGGYMPGGTATNRLTTDEVDYPSQGGVDCGVMHNAKTDKAANQFALQYGYGCNSSLAAGANLPPTSDNKRGWIFRATEMYDHQVTDSFSTEIVALYQYANDGSDQPRTQWASFGLRPVYHFTQHFGVEIEPGIDWTESEADDWSDYLFKGTVALRLTPDRDFFSRPEFRLFATYANWGDDFKGMPSLGGQAFRDKNDGLTFGVQAEHWW